MERDKEMDQKIIDNLYFSKTVIIKKIYAAVAILLVSALLLSTVSYAWLTLSLAPETSDVTTTLGANGNLEMALATSDHLATLEANDMYDDDSRFEFTTGNVVHDNVLWGNLIDLTAIEYGLHTLNMRPAVLNILDGCIAEAPISVGKYSADGRLENFDADNVDLGVIGFSSVYDPDKAQYYAGSIAMSIDDLKAGNFEKEDLVQTILDNKQYGVRIAGLLDYSATADLNQNSANIDLLVDGYCFAIDLLFRTNAPTGNLMLQTEATQRMESEMEEEYVGGGSFIDMNNPKLSAAMKVVFANTLTGEVYALAQADAEGKLWITARADENGNLVPTAEDDAALIKPLTQNQVSAVTAWVFVDGSQVDNSAASTKADTAMKLNLQFSTDAVLNPAYTDKNTNPNYPNRPEMPENPSGPVEPLEVGPVSNLHFEIENNQIALSYDYPTGITAPIDFVLYDIIFFNSLTSKRLFQQNRTNSLFLTEYANLTAGTYDKFHVDSEYHYEVVASADFDNLELVINGQDSTSERLYVRIDPSSESSNYGYTYVITGLTPNTPFFLYTASERVALGTSEGLSYSAVTLGMSDENGNITADLGTYDDIVNLKDNPDELGAELTKLYFKVVECTDPYVSDDGLNASYTLNLRCDWTQYIPGGVGTDVDQSGALGDNIIWSYTTDGTLRISGSGAMAECESGEYPWSQLAGLITNVIIEDGVTTVANHAFTDFFRLQSASFGNDIVEINDYAFYKCHVLQNFILPDGLQTIGSSAFRDCESITSVTMPDSITDLGHWAFVGCSDLESVRLSNNITHISAFGWCESLKSIVIPEGVTSIGSQAFNVCTSLETITLPTTLTQIGYYAFEHCSNLSDVYYNGSKTMWDQIDIGEKNDDLLNATIHYAIEEPDDDSNLTVVDTGNVTDDITWTLYDNGWLKFAGTGAMPNFSAEWDAPWYDHKNSVSTVDISDGITYLGLGNLAALDYAEITIPESVVAIVGHNGLVGQLKTVHYAGSKQQWDALAIFSDNGALVGGTINVAKSDAQVLYSGNIESTDISWTLSADGILTVNGTGAMPDWTETYAAPWDQYQESIKHIVITEGITYVGAYAFDGTPNVQTIKVSATVSQLGEYAFCRCENLLAVTLGKNSSMFEIGRYCFEGCSNLRYINIPDSVTTLGEAAFQACTVLDHIVINGVTSLGERAFYCCENLQSIELAEGLLTIPTASFARCFKLTSIAIPSTVIKIEQFALLSAHDDPFTVYYAGSKEQWDLIVDDGGNTYFSNAEFVFGGEIVTSGNVNDEITWALDDSGVLIINGIGDMPDYDDGVGIYDQDIAEWIHEDYHTVIISVGITSIGDYAFLWSDNLTTVVLTTDVANISWNAFDGCDLPITMYVIGYEYEFEPVTNGSSYPSNITFHYFY